MVHDAVLRASVHTYLFLDALNLGDSSIIIVQNWEGGVNNKGWNICSRTTCTSWVLTLMVACLWYHSHYLLPEDLAPPSYLLVKPLPWLSMPGAHVQEKAPPSFRFYSITMSLVPNTAYRNRDTGTRSVTIVTKQKAQALSSGSCQAPSSTPRNSQLESRKEVGILGLQQHYYGTFPIHHSWLQLATIIWRLAFLCAVQGHQHKGCLGKMGKLKKKWIDDQINHDNFWNFFLFPGC